MKPGIAMFLSFRALAGEFGWAELSVLSVDHETFGGLPGPAAKSSALKRMGARRFIVSPDATAV
jgi:hypothetical protein